MSGGHGQAGRAGHQVGKGETDDTGAAEPSADLAGRVRGDRRERTARVGVRVRRRQTAGRGQWILLFYVSATRVININALFYFENAMAMIVFRYLYARIHPADDVRINYEI